VEITSLAFNAASFRTICSPLFAALETAAGFNGKMAGHQVDEIRHGTFLFCSELVGQLQNPFGKITAAQNAIIEKGVLAKVGIEIEAGPFPAR
jgi:hypothetical protein